MRLLTARQVSQATGIPYRPLLSWISAGWFTPKIVAGEDRPVLLFDDDDAWEVAWFNRIRDHFPVKDWPEVARAIHQIRLEGKTRLLIASVGEPHAKRPKREVRPVSQEEALQLIGTGLLVFLAAVGVGALLQGAQK